MRTLHRLRRSRRSTDAYPHLRSPGREQSLCPSSFPRRAPTRGPARQDRNPRMTDTDLHLGATDTRPGTGNMRIRSFEPLPTPSEVRAELPATDAHRDTVER